MADVYTQQINRPKENINHLLREPSVSLAVSANAKQNKIHVERIVFTLRNWLCVVWNIYIVEQHPCVIFAIISPARKVLNNFESSIPLFSQNYTIHLRSITYCANSAEHKFRWNKKKIVQIGKWDTFAADAVDVFQFHLWFCVRPSTSSERVHLQKQHTRTNGRQSIYCWCKCSIFVRCEKWFWIEWNEVVHVMFFLFCVCFNFGWEHWLNMCVWMLRHRQHFMLTEVLWRYYKEISADRLTATQQQQQQQCRRPWTKSMISWVDHSSHGYV